MSYVPGLLQTEEYARGIIKIVAPKMDPRVEEQRVEARLRRQHVVIGNTISPEGPFNEFTVDEWRHFLAGVKLGDFDGIA